MTAFSRRRRPGVTLMEVLLATFILAIGLVAIMALFPIGAVNMARAITQDRSATQGVNTDATFRYYWKQAWNDPANGTVRSTSPEAYVFSQEPVFVYLQSHPAYGTIPLDAAQPSFPVLIDPVGHLTNAGPNQLFVGGVPILPVRTTLRRCVNYPAANPNPLLIPGYSTVNLNLATGGIDPAWPLLWPAAPAPNPAPAIPFPQIIPAVVRLTTLLDDMTFSRPADASNLAVSGEPADFTGQIDRGGRYNVAWLVQRPRNDVPAEANVTVLVFAGRSPTDTASAENFYPNSTAVPGEKTILIPLPAGATTPGIRRGGWIGFSHTVTQTMAGTQLSSSYPTLDFYRVSGINTDIPGAVVVELESPIKVAGPPNGAGNSYSGPTSMAIVFDNLVEVFDRGTVSSGPITH